MFIRLLRHQSYVDAHDVVNRLLPAKQIPFVNTVLRQLIALASPLVIAATQCGETLADALRCLEDEETWDDPECLEFLSLCLEAQLIGDRFVDAFLLLRKIAARRRAAPIVEKFVAWFLANEMVPTLLKYAQESDIPTAVFVKVATREEFREHKRGATYAALALARIEDFPAALQVATDPTTRAQIEKMAKLRAVEKLAKGGPGAAPLTRTVASGPVVQSRALPLAG